MKETINIYIKINRCIFNKKIIFSILGKFHLTFTSATAVVPIPPATYLLFFFNFGANDWEIYEFEISIKI